jgi:hypothetical protein
MAIINKPIKLLNEQEILATLPNFISISKSEEFDHALRSHEAFTQCLSQSMFASKKRGVLFAFQKCMFAVFKRQTGSDLHLRAFGVLFDQAFTSQNVEKFLSHQFDIMFSENTNQFAFIYKDGQKFASENKKILDSFKTPVEDLTYTYKKVLSKRFDKATKRNRYTLQWENDEISSTSSSLIEDEEDKMPFKKKKTAGKTRPYKKGPVHVLLVNKASYFTRSKGRTEDIQMTNEEE